ncbi:carboxypeptidase-like regulatory domain-containing protein [Pedobacter sandarakinus]|uniref:carboxypeptidase-like regulatory domain-containing protein n=1 Tax=Pedobacter sandarakinus TaxID=353156 RepID=UPI0022467142|nr:carboxypeptidase-like regulatory domain-containing protein [Pedobacter sandarakinus]MCX2573832.1 carboxypeptidase-like regulatory domain-containing protein [Pedobacter sandarakinus]
MNNDWLDIDVLEDYLDGKLDAKAMHFVEKQALEDPFVAEALEGLKQSPKRKQTLSILQKQLHDRIAEKPIRRKLWGITTQRLSIAATATVAFIAVSILFFMRESNRRNAETAARKANGVIVRLDTSTAVATTKPTDTAANAIEDRKAAIIDQAIGNAKTNELAINTKKAPLAQRPAFESAESETVEDLTRFNKAKATANLDDRKSNPGAPQLSEVVVARAAAPMGEKMVFIGSVVDQRNGNPIPGAVVKLAGSDKITTTNVNGYFALPADSSAKDKDLIINALGFKEEPVVGAQDPRVIREALSGNKSLNEIALITGSNGRKKENIPAPKILLRAEQNLNGKPTEEITKPVPVATIDYKQYLENNNKRYNPKGPEQYVVLRFKVKKDGRPTDIKVIKSINNKTDAEARRLVLNGPDWVLPKNGNNIVEMSIKF